ncbi:MAG: DUF371 domain-containing protein [Candidatus Hodarchaeota archaeon]
MTILEQIYAFGHKNIRCSHKTTIEITKDIYLSKKGTCILGINASKGCSDLNPNLKELIQNGQKIHIIISVDNIKDNFYGYGHRDLKLLSKDAMVFRKSNFICDRTVLINCNKSSLELNRVLIEKLTNPEKIISIIFTIDELNE